MEQILELVKDYGLETVIIALLVNVVVGVVKMPIKVLAGKLKDCTKVTRFIVFLPIIFGFLFSFGYAYFIQQAYSFNKEFVTLWLTSSSLSLTFYAIFEKIFPSKKKILSEAEIKASETILENIKQLIDPALLKKEEQASEDKVQQEKKEESINKIILRGHSDAQVAIEKK